MVSVRAATDFDECDVVYAQFPWSLDPWACWPQERGGGGGSL